MRTLHTFIGTIKRIEWVCWIYSPYGTMLNSNHCIMNVACKLSCVTWLVRNNVSTLWNEIVICCYKNKQDYTLCELRASSIVESLYIRHLRDELWGTEMEVKQTASQPDGNSNEGMRYLILGEPLAKLLLQLLLQEARNLDFICTLKEASFSLITLSPV